MNLNNLAEKYEDKIRKVKSELEKYVREKVQKVENDAEKVDKIVRFEVDRLLSTALNHEVGILIEHNDDTQLLTILKPLVTNKMAALFDKLIKINTIESKAKATETDSVKK